MFGLFKRKTPIEKLEKKYKELMAESHRLSKSNRTASDAKFAEAEKVLEEIKTMEKSN